MNPNPSVCNPASFYTQRCPGLEGGKHLLCACTQVGSRTDSSLFPERLRLAGFVGALPADRLLCKILTCIPLLDYYSGGAQDHQVVQQSNTTSPALVGPSGVPHRAFLAARVPQVAAKGARLSCCQSNRSPGEGAEEMTCHPICRPAGRTGQTAGCANL